MRTATFASMTKHAFPEIGWLARWAGVLALAGAFGCGSATGGSTRQRPAGSVTLSTADAGAAVNTHRGFVSTGHILRSDHFQMLSTLGPPSITAGTSSSARAHLRSGLIPNIAE
jgi:hypothetical protein